MICTMDYIDGSDIDDEAAYRMKDHPGGKRVGVCLKGKETGRYVLVQFDEELTNEASVLLFTLKKNMFQRWLAETYPSKPAIPVPPRPDVDDFSDAMLNEAMASAALSETPIE